MEINNPQVFDHIVAVSGQTLQPTFIAHPDLPIAKIADGLIIWRTSDDVSYMIPGAIMGTNYNVLRAKVLDIGVWNMDLTDTVNVAHGLTADNIRTALAVIIGDDGVSYYPIATGYGAIASDLQGWVSGWDTTNIMLYRKGTGMFDSDIFNDGVMNRGYVMVWYVT